MKEEKVKEIMDTVVKFWVTKHGADNIDLKAVEGLRNVLRSSPHENGIMPVTNLDTGKTHLVPILDIIRFGLKGTELDKYPITELE